MNHAMFFARENKLSKYRSTFKTAGLFLLLFVGSWFLSPPEFGLGKYKIPAGEVSFRKTDVQLPSTRFYIEQAEGDMNEQFYSRTTGARRFHFQFDEADLVDGPKTIYIPSTGGSARLGVSGSYAGLATPHGFFAPSFGTHWQSFDVPRHFLLPGRNRIDIYLNEDTTRSGVRQIYFGPRDEIQSAIKTQQNWMDLTPKIARIGFGLCALMCLGGIFIAQRKTDFLAMGLLSLTLFFQGLYPLLQDTALFSGSAQFIRFALPVVALLGVIIAILARKDRAHVVSGYYLGLALFALIGPLLAMLFLVSPIFFSGQMFVATLMLLGALPLLFIMSGHDLFAAFMRRQSRLQQLTLKVSEQSEALDEKTELIVKEMRQRALMEERQRFTRDIHDGIGGTLLSLLLQIRTGDINRKTIAEEIQLGIQDLRMVVDSIDHIGEDLNVILETFKARVSPQMSVARITLNWQQPDNIQGRLTGESGGTLHLYRILQEAMTNIVRHAQATKVDFIITQPTDYSSLDITIKDNGIGITENDEDGAGNGLKNIRTRTKMIGAQFTIKPAIDGSGTEQKLTIPLSRRET